MLSLAVWTSVLIVAGYNAIVALGVYVALMSGQLSVGHAAIMGIGAYTAAIITTYFGLPLPVAIAAGMAVGALIGSVLSLLTLRMSPLVAGLTTLGFGETMSVIAFNTSYIGGAHGLQGIPFHTNLTLTYGLLAVALFLTWRLDNSRLGLAARAVRDNLNAAGAAGINYLQVKVVTFALGGALAALGGALSAHYILVVGPDEMGFYRSLGFLIFVIFGGSYTFVGPFVGALFLTVLPELLRFSIYDRYTIYGAILVLAILLRPQGIVTRIPTGGAARFLAWATRGRARSEAKTGSRAERLPTGRLPGSATEVGARSRAANPERKRNS